MSTASNLSPMVTATCVVFLGLASLPARAADWPN